MKNDVLRSNRVRRLLAQGWLMVCLAGAAVLAAAWPNAHFSSSVLSLLPSRMTGDLPLALHDGFMRRLDRQLVWLISPGKKDDDGKLATAWLDALRSRPWIGALAGPVDGSDWGRFFFEHRNGLVDPATRRRLAEGGGEPQADWVLAQLYSAFAGVSGSELKNDPLLLTRSAQMALAQNAGRMEMNKGWLTVKDDEGRRWYMVRGELADRAHRTETPADIVADLAALEQKRTDDHPDFRVLSQGALFYNAYASEQVKHDVSTFGTVTIAGVLLLIWGVFRSFRPLFLCFLSVGVGAMAGAVAVLLTFDEIHLMTLAMSVSVVGVSADYTIYYLTERMVHGAESGPWESLRKVRAALLTALGATILAYGVMMLAPFPTLRQLGLFAVSGLAASCLSVIFWHPWLSLGLPTRAIPAAPQMTRWLALWRDNPRFRIGMLLAAGVFSVAGLFGLKVDDDISRLQALPQPLVQQEKTIALLTGHGADQKWFVVYGDDPEQTLQRLESFAPRLEEAKREGLINGYRLLPLNSMDRQRQDLELLRRAAPLVINRLKEAGVALPAFAPEPAPVAPDLWLASSASEGWRLLWLSLPDGATGVLVPVNGASDPLALARLADGAQGVVRVDRKASFDALFSFYRVLLSGLLPVALGVIALGYVVRFGWKFGLTCIAPSVLSLGCGLASLAFCGRDVTLFSMLALVLVLGIGVNYTLFFSNPKGTPQTSLLAVLAAMTAALLTLGMLVFSSTPAVSSFGIVVTSGVFAAFLLSPLSIPREKKP